MKLLLLSCYLSLSVFPLLAAPLRIVTEEFPPYQIRQHNTAAATQPQNTPAHNSPVYHKPKHGASAYNLQLHGWSVSIVQQLMAEAALDYRFDVLPWARAFKEAQQSPDVLIFSLLRTAEREADFVWIVPLCPMRVSFYTAAHRADVQIQTLAQASRYMVGVENGQANYQFLRQNGFSEQHNLQVVGHNHQLQQMLQLGRIDLMLVSDVFVANLPDKGARLRRVFTAHALERYLYLAARHDANPALVSQLQQAWQRLKNRELPACQQVTTPPF